jgi:signal transduction histidine kinase/CheY-like chemotaxis protein
VHFTAEWSEMLGGPAVETTTTVAELLALVHPEDLPAIHQTSRDLVTGVRSGYRIQHRVRNRAGEWIWIDSAGSVSDRDPAGHVLRVVGTNTDISELKRVQHDLEAAKQDLEERVGSRTIALGRLNDILKTQIKQEIAAQEELKLAKEAAEAANTAKSEFLANMSHEIRTPMHGILGLTELVLAGDIGSEERDHLKLVSDSGRVLLQLIDDLLDFSKIEAGRLELEAVDFSPAACVEEVIRLMAARAEAKRIRLQSRPGEGVPQWIVGDPVRFRQILFNLVGNAVKFTERGSVEIVMGVVGSADPQLARREAELQIAVVDTGIGILEDKLTTIFQPFTQADSSMTRRFGGTGLGLAITAKLCTMMGGSIRVDSELGKGSTFHVRLPVRLPQPADMASKAPEQVSFVVPSEEVSSDRVALVAEDNPVNQRLALKILERLGYRVIIAVDGRQAVESYFAQRPDVILMDVQMPLMDGLTATAQIRDGERDLPGAPRVPIIGLTANALPGDRERCLAAGMDDYLPKPFNAAALRAMIDRWLVSL